MITGSVNCMVIGIEGKVYLKEATCIELCFFEMRGIRWFPVEWITPAYAFRTM